MDCYNIRYIIKLFYEGLFKDHERYKVLFGFAMVTFGIAFALIWLSIGLFNIYARLYLKKADPGNWEKYRRNSFVFHKDYKKWLKGEYEDDNIFFKIYRKHEKFGKICFYVWLTFFVIVTLAVIIVDVFDVGL